MRDAREKGQADFARKIGGRCLGGIWAEGRFTPHMLAERRTRRIGIAGRESFGQHPLFDHCEYYKRGREPLAIVSHSYIPPAQINDEARRYVPDGLLIGLIYGESWYFKGCMPLVICHSELMRDLWDKQLAVPMWDGYGLLEKRKAPAA